MNVYDFNVESVIGCVCVCVFDKSSFFVGAVTGVE